MNSGRAAAILTLGSGVDELTSVESFNGNEILSSVLILVRVSEQNLGEGSSTARVVNDFLHNSLDVTKQSITLTNVRFLPFSLGEIKSSELSWCDSL